MKFKFLEHTADVKFQAYGKTLNQAFENSSLALASIFTKEKIKTKIKKKIIVKGKDKESLLYNFLEEFLFLVDSENFILAKINKIKISGDKNKFALECEIIGDNVKNYSVDLDVKAITYNQMFVKFDDRKKEFVCQVVVDV